MDTQNSKRVWRGAGAVLGVSSPVSPVLWLGSHTETPPKARAFDKICSPLLPLMQYPGSIKIHSLLASGITDDGILQAKLTLLFQDWQMSETLEIW